MVTVCACHCSGVLICVCFFFQAEDGIRDLVRSRGLGDVYKRQHYRRIVPVAGRPVRRDQAGGAQCGRGYDGLMVPRLSLIHI